MLPYGAIRPFLHLFTPERAHGLAISALKMGLAGSSNEKDDPLLATTVWGLQFLTESKANQRRIKANQRGQAHLFTQYPRNTQRDSVKMDATAAWHARILPNNSSLAP